MKAIEWVLRKAVQLVQATGKFLFGKKREKKEGKQEDSLEMLDHKKKDETKIDDPEKQARWIKGVAAVNKLKMAYEQAPVERSILDNRIERIKRNFAFAELEVVDEKNEFFIYGAMSSKEEITEFPKAPVPKGVVIDGITVPLNPAYPGKYEYEVGGKGPVLSVRNTP